MNSLEYNSLPSGNRNSKCFHGGCGQKILGGSVGSSGSCFDAPSYKSPCQRNDNSLGNNSLTACEYTIDKSLGKGVFGEVFQATAADGHLVALKRLPKNGLKFDLNLVNREADVGKRLQGHDGLAKLETCFETVSNVYLVFEYVDGADLFKLMEDRNFRPLPEAEVKNLCHQLVDSLIFIHSKKVAHRDIKLDNILLDSKGNTKMIDFGLASMDEDEVYGCRSFVGSPEYVAPEIIQRKPYSGYKADVYSLGMVLYCMIFGQFPFIPEKRFESILNGEEHPALEWPDHLLKFPTFFVSKTAKDLLSAMLEVDPAKRISMEQLANHSWLQGCGTNKDPNLNDSIPNVPNGIGVF